MYMTFFLGKIWTEKTYKNQWKLSQEYTFWLFISVARLIINATLEGKYINEGWNTIRIIKI